MSRSGNVWDNAVMESFFSTLKTEQTARQHYATRDAARADVFDYIERFYNPIRRHSTLGYVSPMQFEQAVAQPRVHGTRDRSARAVSRTMRRLLLRTNLWQGNRESYRSTFFSRDSVFLWSLTTYTRNQSKFAALRSDPKYQHLQWVEITQPGQASNFISTHAREEPSQPLALDA